MTQPQPAREPAPVNVLVAWAELHAGPRAALRQPAEEPAPQPEMAEAA